MKKILISVGTIAVVAVLVVGATGAFYNDTEASNGNIFVAGSIDLKVDHTAQTYNGVDCKTCSVDVFSSTATKVVAASPGASEQGPFPLPSKNVSNPHPNWLPDSTLAPAQWIWATDPTTVPDTTNGATYTFENKFQWNGTVSTIDLNFAFASDNGYKIVLNGVSVVDNLLSEFNYNGSTISLTTGEKAIFIANIIPNGENTLQIIVRNKPLAGDPVTQNPAGLLFNLNIHRSPTECAADSAFQQVCRLWTEKDLSAGDTFFNFDDVKPADWGTNEISLHVSSNDAYSCLIVGNKDDQENSLLSPEIAAGDTTGVGNPSGKGELSNFLNVFTWRDTNGDGVYNTGEPALGSGPLSSLTSIMTMDPSNGEFLTSTTTANIGLAWCAGTLTATPDSAFICNGNGMTNIAQSDSFSASLTAYAEQTRNNANFSCGNINIPGQDDEGNGGALGPAPVSLLSASNFAIIAETSITDANPSVSAVIGNIAINPAAGSTIAGLSCSSVTGTLYSSGGYTGGYNSNTTCAVTAPATALAVRSAMEAAYADAAGRTGPTATELGAGNIGGMTLAPGLYKWSSDVTIPTNVTLSGDANDVWIFQIAGDLSIASAKEVKLSGGALAKNVFWQVGGPNGATLGTTSIFNGTILSAKQVIVQTGAVLNGGAFAQSQVTLDGNAVTAP